MRRQQPTASCSYTCLLAQMARWHTSKGEWIQWSMRSLHSADPHYLTTRVECKRSSAHPHQSPAMLGGSDYNVTPSFSCVCAQFAWQLAWIKGSVVSFSKNTMNLALLGLYQQYVSTVPEVEFIDSSECNYYPEIVEQTLQYKEHRATCCTFNSVGSYLAAGCETGVVLVWNFITRGVVRKLRAHSLFKWQK